MSAPRTWIARAPDEAAAGRLAQALGLPPLVAGVLVNRGLDDPEQAQAFLEPKVEDLRDPFDLPDMELAAERVVKALIDQEPILIYGDADVDGLSSTGLLVQFLTALGQRPEVHVPNRAYEGYSLTDAGLEIVREKGARVVITVDNGTSSLEHVARLQDEGVDVVITDHHLPGPEAPPAHAFVNPTRADSRYGFTGLAGVGVAFKLACAVATCLQKRGRASGALSSLLGESLAWVAMGTVSDMMPLVDENRVLVSRGLRALPQSSHPGLRALCALAGVGPSSTCRAEDLAWRVAPRLNAASRMGQSPTAVATIIADDPETATRHAAELDRLNKERQAAERSILGEIESLAEASSKLDPILLDSDTWGTGLLGLVAGRLSRQHGRPAVLISSSNGEPAKGSCRSVAGFDVHAALGACQEHLEGHGGHAMAAGFSIRTEQVDSFREAFIQTWHDHVQGAVELPPLEYEGELPLAALTRNLVEQIDRLEPFGSANPRPVLGAMGVEVVETRTMGADGTHLAMQVAQGPAVLRAVAFGRADLAARLPPGSVIDLLFTPKLNRFRGRCTVELEVVDVREPR